MTIEISKQDEELVSRLIKLGRFQNASEAVHEAINRLGSVEEEVLPFPQAPIYPPGSLLHLYTDQENEKELRLVRSHPKKLEEF